MSLTLIWVCWYSPTLFVKPDLLSALFIAVETNNFGVNHLFERYFEWKTDQVTNWLADVLSELLIY